jgi:hypothetical protein
MKSPKSNRQREVIVEGMIKGVLKSFLFYLPILLGFMAWALSISLGCFIAGFTGIIMLIKKESPSGIATVRGKSAIIIGILITSFFWTGAVFFFLIEVLKWKF